MERDLRIGISLALSALLAQAMYAQEVACLTSDTGKLPNIGKGQTCTINNTTTTSDATITNEGEIILNTSVSKLVFDTTSGSAITINNNSSEKNRGTISVVGSGMIDASASTDKGLSIEGQDIFVDEYRTLTLKTTKLILGDSGNKLTTIVGNSSNASSSSSWGVTLDTTTGLETKNVEFKNIRISSSTITSITNTASTFNNAHIISSSTTSDLTINADSNSTFTLIGESNTISAGKKNLNITGEHKFSGSGILDFVGEEVILGDITATKLTLSSTNEKEIPTLGFSAESKVLFSNVESSGLTLQIIKSGSGATLHNLKTTFKGGMLQAIDRDNKDQTLVIESWASDLTAGVGGISILSDVGDSTTTFKGSNIEIYGQEIAIGKDVESSSSVTSSGNSTLVLNTVDDSGDIKLGKQTKKISHNEYVNIVGVSQTQSSLQLRSLTTTFGGEVTLKDLKVSTQAKNELEDEGMIFSLSKDSALTLSGVTLTSGIDKNYQDLSFTTLDGSSTLTIADADSSIKASSLSFTNQKIDLSNAGSGKALNLYSYGNVALTNTTGSGVGNFAFTDTTITDGSGASLNLYSSDGAKVIASNLTLKNLTLTSCKIGATACVDTDPSQRNAIDLSDTSSNLITQGNVTIKTADFLYDSGQGIGMDIKIDGGTNGDKLTLSSDKAGSTFTFGGTITIDNSQAKDGTPSANPQIVLQLGSSSGTDNQSVDLKINGGLTAIGNANLTGTPKTTTTTLKAKSFTFGEDSVVSSINGTLDFNASGDINIKDGLTILQGLSDDSKGKITTSNNGGGKLTLGNVEATGITEISGATFSNSSLKIRSISSSVNTLTITSANAVSGIQSIDISDANLTVQNGSSQELQLNVDGSIVSSGTSTIAASEIKAGDGSSSGTYSVNIQNGTLTLKETSQAGNGIGSLTLGTEGKQGGNLILTKDGSDYNTLKTTKITSYQTSSITADGFDFSSGDVEISSSGGTLTLNAQSASETTLKIKSGMIELDNGGINYTYKNFGQNSAIIKLYDDSVPLNTPTPTPTLINSQGDSFIQGSSLDLKGNEITSSGGMLTLKGLSGTSTLGAVTINNNGGLTATDSSGSTATDIKLSSTLTLTANAPYVSSTSPLGGGKFGVLQAQSVNFAGSGGATSPLIRIQVKDSPLSGEELFTLQEGGQIVVWTTGGITKTTAKTNQAITLDDITIDNGGYKSLSLDAQLVYNDDTKKEQVNAIKVNLSVTQTSASDLTESISDNTAKEQMQTILTQGDNKEIIDSILGSTTNPLKVGFAENIAQGNVVVVGNALNYIDDTFKSVAESIHLNDRVQTQIYLSQVALVEGRMARHNNPHQNTSELLSFIRSYHNTHYASSDEELPASEESETHHSGKGSLWVSYDGGLATGGSSNSTINGISAGYDHALDSGSLVGGFVSYAYGAFDGTFLHNTSHNVGFGLYSRMVFGNNEVDLTLSQNIGLVTSDINVGNTTMPSLLNGAMEYNLYRTNVMARYGYNIKVGEEESPYYLKPLFGLNMSYTYQEGSESNAVASITMNEASLFKLEVSAGMEMRKYINEGTYFFVMPLIERELYGNSCDMNVGFVDSENLSYTLDYQSQTSVALYAGGEGNLTENLALSGSVGVKVGIEKSEVLTNWSVGLKYKF